VAKKLKSRLLLLPLRLLLPPLLPLRLLTLLPRLLPPLPPRLLTLPLRLLPPLLPSNSRLQQKSHLSRWLFFCLLRPSGMGTAE